MTIRVRRAASLRGALTPPPDKSLTHRAFMLGALAEGRCRITNPLRSADTDSTRRCLAQLGATFEEVGDAVELESPPEWLSPEGPLDCGNSGTTMRLLAGIIASHEVRATMVGDASLSRRPMRRVLEPLSLMGAKATGDYPPITVEGTNHLRGIHYKSPTSSAQVKSAILLAGLGAEGETWVEEPHQSRDHTERMLSALGVPIKHNGTAVGLDGPRAIPFFEFSVPGDLSAAAFFLVAGAIVPGSHIEFAGVGVNPTRSGVLDVLRSAGVDVVRHNPREEMKEPVADLSVSSAAALAAFTIDAGLVPRLIDEIPVLAVLATQCAGTTQIRGARELRVKESDRIETVASGLRAMGAEVQTLPDGMDIQGPCALQGATIDAQLDHRIAMAFAVAGLVAEGETVIEGAEAVATSYPAFESDLRRLAGV